MASSDMLMAGAAVGAPGHAHDTDASLYRHLDDMSSWDDQRQVLEVIDVIDESASVKTFTFRSDSQTWFRYQPGQFITLELPADPDEPLYRTYTLSSSPSRPFTISVTVKAQADSVGTRWMFDHLRSGMYVKAYGPAGEFSLHQYPAAKYLFISAGSGVTPMMSMLRWLNDCSPQTDVVFVNCARQPDEIIFRRELELLGSRLSGLSLAFMVEQRVSREMWTGHVGRIDSVRLPLLAPDFLERAVFCCGPEPFMRAVREMLGAAGFDLQHYHQESFGTSLEEQLPQQVLEPEEYYEEHEILALTPVRFSLSNIDAEGVEGQTILQTARASAVRIPAACEFGLCGTCKVKKLSGDVEMQHNGGILDHEIEAGYILACCSKPLTATEIEA